jgi:hypothetical protein
MYLNKSVNGNAAVLRGSFVIELLPCFETYLTFFVPDHNVILKRPGGGCL